MNQQVLFRPNRKKYLRKKARSKKCVFCLAAENKINFKSLCVYKSKYTMVLLNKFPYNSGHILVLPIRHIADLADLSEKESSDLWETVRKATSILQKTYKPGGLNIGLNLGRAAGAGIPDHIHIHAIPRWSGDLNFFPLIARTKVVVEELEETYSKLRKAFQK